MEGGEEYRTGQRHLSREQWRYCHRRHRWVLAVRPQHKSPGKFLLAPPGAKEVSLCGCEA